MPREAAEMPFLDHLEELRTRILRSLAALVVGVGVGIWVVQQFAIIEILKAPIAPFLPSGRLVILSPTEPIMIVLKLGAILGAVLVSPFLLFQVWGFLSPALYDREKKAIIPALTVGLLLFLTGAVLGFTIVVPRALPVLFGVQVGVFENMITYDKYFGFVIQICLALGISFELPLVMIILAVLGVVTPAMMSRFRRHAIVLSFVAGAILSPGADVFSMLLMTAPLIVLYEVGLAGAKVVQRRKLRRAAASASLVWLVAALGGAATLAAQEPPPRPPVKVLTRPDSVRGDSASADSVRLRALQTRDSVAAARLGLPRAPSRQFAPADSVMRDLLDRLGFAVTRFRGDTAVVRAEAGEIDLVGRAMAERGGATVEADRIRHRQESCELLALGSPRLFGQGSPVIGDTVRFDTCRERGVVQSALTTVEEQGANWFVRGNLAIDSAQTRVYAAGGEVSSCDLPVPHFHFSVKQVKWVSRSMMVARPAVLYIRDVPILWLPFLFQDTKPGRRSGILPPQFGLNDIIRPTGRYNRQVTGAGYYWVPNEFIDLSARVNWYANRYFEWVVRTNYRWLDRFVQGDLEYSSRREPEGARGYRIGWNHTQNFSLTTSLNARVDYASNTSIINRNAIDPLLTTQQVSSSLNLQRRFAWGSAALGGNRRQTLTDGAGQQTLPSLSISPKPFDIGQHLTWSPGLTASSTSEFGTSRTPTIVVRPDGTVDTLAVELNARSTNLNLDTPLRFGTFNWRNALRITDRENAQRVTTTYRVPDESTPDPTDSVTVSRVSNGGFSTDLRWDTGINLPILFQGSWKLQPSLNVVDVLPSYGFGVRNERTGGEWVFQGKRAELSLSANPTFFGFYGGLGPLSRIRHSVSPSLRFAYSPRAAVSERFADAVRLPGGELQRESPVSRRAGIALSQNFEGKAKRAEGDTLTDERNLPKVRLLSINTSGVDYDFEQAKEPGRTGWVTPTVTNQLQSDLVPNLQLSFTHDLWDGPVGFEDSEFAPFLTSVSASFNVTGGTLRGLASLFGLGGTTTGTTGPRPPTQPAFQPGFGPQETGARGPGMQQFGGGASGSFQSTINLSINRARPSDDPNVPSIPTQSSVTLRTRLSPTRYWGLSWDTAYNATDKKFEYHRLSLERDLHEWRAAFNFYRNPNGNFSLFFTVFLTDLPDLKADYNQTTIAR